MLRTVFAAVAVGVLSTPVWAGGGNALDPASYTIGDRDAYEDDYSDEFDKATEGEHKARTGKKERLTEKSWEFFEFIKDGDPMWAGPMKFEGGGPFQSLNTRWPMEAARTLEFKRFYFELSGQMFNQQFDETNAQSGQDVHWRGRLNLGIARLSFGLPCYSAGGFELGVKYTFGELTELGHNDIFWYVGRAQVIRDHDREYGSKALEANIKWNVFHLDDGVTGLSINIKGKKSMAEVSELLDTNGYEAGANLAFSVKAWRFGIHTNLGAIYTKSTRLQFHSKPDNLTDTDPDRVRTRPFATGGLAITFEIFDFLMIIGQVECQTNAWRHEMRKTYTRHVTGFGSLGLRGRIGPVIVEGGIGRGFNDNSARIQGEVTAGIKF
ncbi:MAG: hypothetical protein IT452_16815 [Planctomycetia bacterium]|nr:hypothetical protein [Planctomycetia bacterium]